MSHVPIQVVEVRAWGRSVGAVSPGPARGYSFEYQPAWSREGAALAPFLTPQQPVGRIHTYQPTSTDTWRGLPPFVADSLPDDFGNALVDAWMSRHGVAVDHITPLDRLGYLGVRGMGALEFVPDTGPNGPSPTAIDLSDLIVAARAAVHGSLLDDNEAQRSLQEIIDVGTSAGGARAKAILNINAETGEIRSGHLPPLSGYQPWLLKFDGVGVDRQLGSSQVYGRIEYAYSHMARAAGIHMAESQLLQENGRAHFISRRFDRDSHGNKVHMQTLCALYGVDYRLRNTNDYSQLMMCIRELGLGQEALVEGFRRAVFNVATMNRDDHAKNFAFLLPHEGAWQLSPAYDVTFAYNPQGVWTAHHQMGINGTFDNITRADLLRFADEHGVQAGGAIISDVLDAVASWPEFARHAGLTSSSIDEVSRHFQHLARRRP